MIRRSGVPGTISIGAAVVHAHHPLRDIQVMRAIGRDAAAGEIPLDVPRHGSRTPLTDWVVAAVEGMVRRRAEPHIPIHPGRWSLRWKIEGLAGSVPVAVDVLQRPDPAVLNEAAGGGEVVDRALLEAPLEDPIMATEGIDHDPRFVNREGHGLLAVDVLTGPCGHRRDDRMPSVPRGDQDGIDIRTRQDLAEVLRGRYALVVSTLYLGRVRGFHRVPCVIHAPFVDVAHGDQLQVRVAEHPSHVPVTHDADADGSDVDSIAGGLQTDSRQYPRGREQADPRLENGATPDRPLKQIAHLVSPFQSCCICTAHG